MWINHSQFGLNTRCWTCSLHAPHHTLIMRWSWDRESSIWLISLRGQHGNSMDIKAADAMPQQASQEEESLLDRSIVNNKAHCIHYVSCQSFGLKPPGLSPRPQWPFSYGMTGICGPTGPHWSMTTGRHYNNTTRPFRSGMGNAAQGHQSRPRASGPRAGLVPEGSISPCLTGKGA